MAKGLCRTSKPQLGESARVDWGSTDGEPYLTRITCEANRYEPPFDQLPTRDEYEAVR